MTLRPPLRLLRPPSLLTACAAAAAAAAAAAVHRVRARDRGGVRGEPLTLRPSPTPGYLRARRGPAGHLPSGGADVDRSSERRDVGSELRCGRAASSPRARREPVSPRARLPRLSRCPRRSVALLAASQARGLSWLALARPSADDAALPRPDVPPAPPPPQLDAAAARRPYHFYLGFCFSILYWNVGSCY